MKPFFDINIKILKLGGLWMPLGQDEKYKNLILVKNFTFIFYAMVFFTIAQILTLKESSSNINDLVKNLNMSMSFLLTFFKVVLWLKNRKVVIGIMEVLDVSWLKFRSPGDDLEGVVLGEKKVKDRLTLTFFYLAFTVPTSAALLTFVNVFMDREDFEYKLPYASYVPFSYKSGKASYCLAVVYQCLALLICGTITVGFDMLYIAIVSFTSAHLKILQKTFAEIGNDGRDSEKNDKKRMEVEFTQSIQHLQLILRICELMENIFTYILLLQILVSLIVFCTCLYLVSTIPIGSKIFGNELAYMLAIENQLALYCYAGNKLTLNGSKIVNAVYTSNWLESSLKFRKNMIFTMMRMNKPIRLTAGKFTTLTLATFVTIGRGSYSLLAVLKNSQN